MTKYKSEGGGEPPLLALDGWIPPSPPPSRRCGKLIVRQVQRRVTNGNRRVELRSWWVYN